MREVQLGPNPRAGNLSKEDLLGRPVQGSVVGNTALKSPEHAVGEAPGPFFLQILEQKLGFENTFLVSLQFRQDNGFPMTGKLVFPRSPASGTLFAYTF